MRKIPFLKLLPYFSSMHFVVSYIRFNIFAARNNITGIMQYLTDIAKAIAKLQTTGETKQ